MNEKLCFVFGIYTEWHLARRLAAQIRTFYKGAPIIALADGTNDPDFAMSCDSLGINFLCGDRLKLPQFGGEWSQRLFLEFLKTDSSTLIKLDPDTCLWRQFSYIPNADWFGSLGSSYKYPYPRGGCVGFRRAAVEKIVASELLLAEVYKCESFSYDRYGYWRWLHENHLGEAIALQDWILADVGQKLGLRVADWDEVNIQFRQIPDNPDLKWAATHPHPTINNDDST